MTTVDKHCYVSLVKREVWAFFLFKNHTYQGGCCICPPAASNIENRAILIPPIARFPQFPEQRACDCQSAALCSAPLPCTQWSAGLWRGWKRLAQALSGSLRGWAGPGMWADPDLLNRPRFKPLIGRLYVPSWLIDQPGYNQPARFSCDYH